LTKPQRAAIRKFEAKRLEETDRELGLTETVLEALKILLDGEGWSVSEFGR
jgi:hypothetical protein